MVLWFRFLLTVVRGILKGKIDVLAPHTSAFRAYPILDSEFRFLNAARYLSFCELCINEVNVRSGFFKSALKQKFFGVTCNTTVHYIKPVSILKTFQVTTKVLGWDEVFIYRQCHIHQGGKLKFVALYRIIIADIKGKHSPEEVLKKMGYFELKSPQLPKDIERLEFRADKSSDLSFNQGS